MGPDLCLISSMTAEFISTKGCAQSVNRLRIPSKDGLTDLSTTETPCLASFCRIDSTGIVAGRGCSGLHGQRVWCVWHDLQAGSLNKT